MFKEVNLLQITQTYLIDVHVFLKYLAISIPEPAEAIQATIIRMP